MACTLTPIETLYKTTVLTASKTITVTTEIPTTYPKTYTLSSTICLATDDAMVRRIYDDVAATATPAPTLTAHAISPNRVVRGQIEDDRNSQQKRDGSPLPANCASWTSGWKVYVDGPKTTTYLSYGTSVTTTTKETKLRTATVFTGCETQVTMSGPPKTDGNAPKTKTASGASQSGSQPGAPVITTEPSKTKGPVTHSTGGSTWRALAQSLAWTSTSVSTDGSGEVHTMIFEGSQQSTEEGE